MDTVQLRAKADEDMKAAEEFFEPANLAAVTMLSSSLGWPPQVNCGMRVKPKPTLDQLDRR
jgi:hypothetical protein